MVLRQECEKVVIACCSGLEALTEGEGAMKTGEEGGMGEEEQGPG
jgi:hypothetical protein